MSFALFTDSFQLVMACALHRKQLHTQEAVFHLSMRQAPCGGAFGIATGLETVVGLLRGMQFSEEDFSYLAGLPGTDGNPLFDMGFLEYLHQQPFTCTLHAVPEGSVVFPDTPLLRIEGPLLQCLLLETLLVNVIQFQTLVATKAARVCIAAGGDPVLEYGLRHAPGIDGSLAASRAAHLGGCVATSNVLAGKTYGIPVRGTYTHNWVLVFDDEIEAFVQFAGAMPNNCTLIVDTYDTLAGVQHAIFTGMQLRTHGYELTGIRLDVGPLEDLSKQARLMLDSSGFAGTAIVASGALDEFSIEQMRSRGASVNVWAAGGRMVAPQGLEDMGMTYRISAIRNADETQWHYRPGRFPDPARATTPGLLQVWRTHDGEGQLLADMIYNEADPAPTTQIYLPDGSTQDLAGQSGYPLLVPIFDRGRLLYIDRDLSQKRAYAQQQVRQLPEGCRALLPTQPFPVGLEANLAALRAQGGGIRR